MERIKSLKFENKTYTDQTIISKLLLKNGFNWLNNAEIENAVLEIKSDKLYWHSGIWYYGVWVYGIWLDGIFRYGDWRDGVFYNGVFENGIWYNGVFMNGEFKGGEFLNGDWRDGVKTGGVFKNISDVNEKIKKFSEFELNKK